MKKIEYTVKEGNEKVIYEATFDPNNLIDIRKNIIEYVGISDHVSGDTDYPGFGLDFDLVRNYRVKPTEEVMEYDTEVRDVYHVDYDLIKEPDLAVLIKNFITCGDTELIDYIYSDAPHKDSKGSIENLQTERISLIDQATSILNRGKYDEDINFDTFDDIITNIKSITKNINVNKKRNLKNEADYFDLIKKEITIKEVGRMDIKTYEKAKKFIRLDRGN